MKTIFPLAFLVMILGCSNERPSLSQDWDSPFKHVWSSDEYLWVGTTQESSPLPLGDSLVFMSIGQDVVMLEQETGEVRWKTHVDDNTNIQTHVFKSDENKIYATHSRDIRAYDIFTGDVAWISEFPDDGGTFSNDEVVLYNNRLYVPGFHQLHCVESGSGQTIWTVNVGDSSAVNDLVLNNGKLYSSIGGFKPKGIMVLNAETGDLLNTFILNDGFGKSVMTPIIENNIMYVGSSWQKPFGVQAFDLDTKEELWHYQWPNAEFIVDHGIIVDDVLILSLAWDAIGGWDKNTGERLWVTYPTQNYNWSRIGYDGRYVYYAHGWKLHVIEPTTGAILHSTYGPNGEYVYKITVTDKRIFINGWPRNMCWTTYDPEKEND